MLEFYQTDFYLTDEECLFDALIAVTKEKVPYGKILLLSTETDFFASGVALHNLLLNAGHRVVNFVCDNDFSFSVSDVCKLFCAPEDVRAVISLSEVLDQTARYFAYTNGILNISIVNRLSERVLSPLLFLENTGKIDAIFSPCERVVFIKNQIPVCEVFALIELKRAELLDFYLTSSCVSDSVDLRSLSRVKSLLDLAEGTLNYGTVKAVNDALNFIACAISGYSEIFKCSFTCGFMALWRTSLPFDKFFALMDFFLLTCENTILNGQAQNTDYSKITKRVSGILGISEIEVLKNLYEQNGKIIHKNFDKAVLETISIAKAHFDNGKVRYKKLGGKVKQLTAKEKSLLKLSGDTPFALNVFSVVRQLY